MSAPIPSPTAAQQMAQNRNTSRGGAYWLSVVREFWRLSPLRVTGMTGLTWLSALFPAVQIALTASAVQGVADVAGGTPDAMNSVIFAATAMVVLAVTSHLIGAAVQYLGTLLELEFTTKIGEQVMLKGTQMDLQTYEDAHSYDRLQRALRESGGGTAFQIFDEMVRTVTSAISLVSVSAVLLAWNPWIALVIIISPVPALIAHIVFSKRGYEIEYDRTQDRRRTNYYQSLTTTDSSFKEVKLYQLGPYFVERYRILVNQFFRVDRALARRQQGWAAGMGLLSVLISSSALVFALFDTADTGRMGELAGYLAAIGAVQAAASGLLMGFATLYQSTLFVGDLFDYLRLPDNGISGGSRAFPEKLKKGIEFRNVSFRYPGTDVTALEDFSCFIPAGTCCALVGQNGAGKSTVVKLLSRLYAPTSGQILIDDIPIEEYDTDDLQRNIGVVFQDFIRYEMTARENIGFGRVEDMTNAGRVRTAAAASGADAVISRLPDGYDTILGRHFEDGRQLSGGQWQKMAISRAFMRSAPIAILDEPTASIDAEAESEIFAGLRDLYGKATSLVISHRFSTVRIADKIMVLDGGKLIEDGSHDELMKAGGTYAYLFSLQAEAYLADG
ncbi:ABC transporter ATP-binding protein [Streptomyces sp. NBC_00454]|uniref:ABC transporter ATP-binding protein n=1 Tax=Streptomyces sp. NBC_00454 TaxID=2975747 RepID=UPI0030E25D39